MEENKIIEWKDIPGFEGYYQVSTTGLIQSKDRYVVNNKGEAFKKSQVIKPFKNGSGYFQLVLQKEGVKHRPYVHVLVARAFIQNPDNLPEVNHIDHNKLNCCVSNLEWVTKSENQILSAKFYGSRFFRKCKKCDLEFETKRSINRIYCTRSCANKNR